LSQIPFFLCLSIIGVGHIKILLVLVILFIDHVTYWAKQLKQTRNQGCRAKEQDNPVSFVIKVWLK
jgi:uncharacterized membrane protein